MRLELGLSQKLSLQLKLAPQIIQSIEILQLPALSLQELVEAALDENEALERTSDAHEPAEASTEPKTEENGQVSDDQREVEEGAEMLSTLEQLEAAADRDWQDFGRGRGGGGGDEDKKLEAMNNTAAPTESLHDMLHEQFLLVEGDEDVRVIGRHIIFNLDDNGFLPYSLEEILESPELRGVSTMDEAERALKAVQSLEPRGVGARSIVESLLLQLDEKDPDSKMKRAVIQNHLVDINKNKRQKVAR
ncbi:MAG: hypothetical protein V3T86_04845, partial [Planctomycetota bacterium]